MMLLCTYYISIIRMASEVCRYDECVCERERASDRYRKGMSDRELTIE